MLSVCAILHAHRVAESVRTLFFVMLRAPTVSVQPTNACHAFTDSVKARALCSAPMFLSP